MKPTVPKTKKRSTSRKPSSGARKRSKPQATATTAAKVSAAASSSATQSADTSTNVSKASGNGKVGRPSAYETKFCEQAYKLCLLGATDAELADFFGVSEQTVNAWKVQHPEFLESMRAGKEEADATIAESLYHRAKGYSHPETHVSNYQGDVTLTPLTKHYPPDTAAASLWLRNRQPKRWRDKVDHELAGPNGGPIPVKADVTVDPGEAYLRMIGR